MPKKFTSSATLLLVLLLVAGEAFAAGGPRYQRSVEEYAIPDVVLVNQNGERVRLKSLLETNEPVVVDFIYGTCTTICPVLSAGFASLQRKLAKEGHSARLVSISIDPENDTPKIMKEYLERYRAKPGWDFLTGSRPDIDNVMTAFNAYISDKMSHLPLNFIRSSKDGTWIRLYGFIGSKDFLNEFEKAGVQQ
jgi:protein SCO1